MDMNAILGYTASALILLSFLFRDVTTLRIVNTIGCITFVVFGLRTGNYPIIITNAGITLINLYHLLRMK
ncbi:MAG: uroporphyrinogen decarboxylase [Chitinophagales bacterium]